MQIFGLEPKSEIPALLRRKGGGFLDEFRMYVNVVSFKSDVFAANSKEKVELCGGSMV